MNEKHHILYNNPADYSQLSTVEPPFLSCLTLIFSAFLYMYNLNKSALSGCYFISKFPTCLHSWPAFLYATPDLPLLGPVREIHLKLFLILCPSTPHVPFFFFPPLPFSSVPSPFSLSLSKLAFLDES